MMLNEELLKDHQWEIVKNIFGNEKCYLIADMGSGKTASTLYALHMLSILGEVQRTLVIAPLNVAKYSWPDELENWGFCANTKYVNLAGKSVAQRRALLKKDHTICIINRELIRWLCKEFDFDMPYDTLVYDEISRLKGGKTFTPRRIRPDGTVAPRALSEFGHLRKISASFKRVIGLTGTPTQEGVIDLWGQFHLLDQGERLGRSKSAFLQRWFTKPAWGFKHEPRPHSEDEIVSKIKDIAFYVDTASDLEEPILKDIKVQLSQTEMDQYEDMKKEFVFETDEVQDDIEAVHAGALTQKLLQLANGSIYATDKEVVSFHDKKVEAMRKIREEVESPLLVFYSFQFDKDSLLKEFPEAVLFEDLEDPVHQWNAGEVSMMLVHPASCAHGLNLQFGGHTLVWYGLTWSLELYQQANKRLQRPGQTEQVTIYRIVAEDTIDTEIGPKLVIKQQRQDSVMKGLRRDR